jgi:hypothetical protein
MNRKNLLLKDWQQKREYFFTVGIFTCSHIMSLVKSVCPVIVTKATPHKVKCTCPKEPGSDSVVVYLQGGASTSGIRKIKWVKVLY